MFVLFFGSVAVWIVKKAAVALMDCPPMIINLKPSSSDAAKACCQRRNADAQPKFSKFLFNFFYRYEHTLKDYLAHNLRVNYTNHEK